MKPTNWLDRPSPERTEAERALLGGLITDPAQLSPIAQLIEAGDFYRPEHGALFRLLLTMQAGGVGIDLVTVADAARASLDRYGGAAYLAELPEHAVSTSNLPFYAEQIVEAAQLRGLIAGVTDAIGQAFDQARPAAEIRSELLAGLARLAERGKRVRHTANLEELFQALEVQWEEEELHAVPPPLSTGIPELDRVLDGGLHPGQLVTVAGVTGMGKSALALGMAQGWAAIGRTVSYHSLEMPKRWDMTARAVASATGVSIRGVRRGASADLETLRTAARERRTLIINDRPRVSLADVSLEARRLWSAGSLSAVVIDYLGLMSHPRERGDRMDQAIGATMGGLKQLAIELGISVVVLAQCNRSIDRRETPETPGEAWYEKIPLPQLSDLRDSGEIEHASDVVLFPIAAARYGLTGGLENHGAILVAKQRNGPRAIVPCRWDGRSARYLPLDRSPLRAVDGGGER